jgi:putative transposase
LRQDFYAGNREAYLQNLPPSRKINSSRPYLISTVGGRLCPMPRRARQVVGGLLYHVINRGCGRMKLFSKNGDYEAFIRVMFEASARFPNMRLLAYCLMPNHFHLVLKPSVDTELSKFMFWLTMTHVQRWRHAKKLVGLGPLYQGRFKAFAIEADEHFEAVVRYVERNPLRAKLVTRAESWEWSSLFAREREPDKIGALLAEWPILRRADWIRFVNAAQTERDLSEIHTAIRTGKPYGSDAWRQRTARVLGIDLNVRPRGRPLSPGNRNVREVKQRINVSGVKENK